MGNDRPKLGILGGMGPQAALELCQRIVDHTAAGRDQEHIPTDVYKRQILERYQALEDQIRSYNPGLDTKRLYDAFSYADNAHTGQLRKDGSPYITHPLAVAEIAAELELDTDSIIASLLHDTVEDTSATYDDVAKRFGRSVADLVDGVTKLAKVKSVSYTHLPRPGDNVVTTVDLRIQEALEQSLAARVPGLSDTVKGAAGVVMDMKGGVKAIASYPTFDLANVYKDSSLYNETVKDPLNPFYNRATMGLYSPCLLYTSYCHPRVMPKSAIFFTPSRLWTVIWVEAWMGTSGAT